MSANPKLVIVHVTGYGLKQNGGVDRYLRKPCVDPVGQAFSGLAAMQGMPDGPYPVSYTHLCRLRGGADKQARRWGRWRNSPFCCCVTLPCAAYSLSLIHI